MTANRVSGSMARGAAWRWPAAAGIALAALASQPAWAASQIKIQPIKICNDAGNACANAAENLFLAETNKIWAQAGISFSYLAFTSTNSSTFLNLDNQTEVNDLFSTAPGVAGAGIISMWFVNNHFNAWGEVNAIGGSKIVIDQGIFAGGRIDTIAHEVGHLLGLKHDDPGVAVDFLMRSGADRTVPGAIGDITPDGAKLDKLTAAQIATAQGDAKVTAVPEPSTYALLVAGLGVIGWAARRQSLSRD